MSIPGLGGPGRSRSLSASEAQSRSASELTAIEGPALPLVLLGELHPAEPGDSGAGRGEREAARELSRRPFLQESKCEAAQGWPARRREAAQGEEAGRQRLWEPTRRRAQAAGRVRTTGAGPPALSYPVPPTRARGAGLRHEANGRASRGWAGRQAARRPMGGRAVGRGGSPSGERANGKLGRGARAAANPRLGRGTRKAVGAGSRADNLSNLLWDDVGHAPPGAWALPPCEARWVARGPGPVASSSCGGGSGAGHLHPSPRQAALLLAVGRAVFPDSRPIAASQLKVWPSRAALRAEKPPRRSPRGTAPPSREPAFAEAADRRTTWRGRRGERRRDRGPEGGARLDRSALDRCPFCPWCRRRGPACAAAVA